jgi:hypothetical protein
VAIAIRKRLLGPTGWMSQKGQKQSVMIRPPPAASDQVQTFTNDRDTASNNALRNQRKGAMQRCSRLDKGWLAISQVLTLSSGRPQRRSDAHSLWVEQARLGDL